MAVSDNIITAVLILIIFLIAGGLISRAESKHAIERLEEKQQFYLNDLNGNNVNTFLLLTDEYTGKQIGTLVSYSMYQRRRFLNASGTMVDVQQVLAENLDAIFGPENYYLEIKPRITDVTLNFVIDGSNSLAEERRELAQKLPLIINAARGANRTVLTHIYISSLSPKCSVFQQQFQAQGITNATCQEIDAEHNTGEMYLDPASSNPNDYRRKFNITPPYNFPGKPTTTRRPFDYYEPDWAAGLGYASNIVATQRTSQIDLLFPMGDELATSSFADRCFTTPFAASEEGKRILCDLCDQSCSPTSTTATEQRSWNQVTAALKMARQHRQIINPIYAYNCEFLSPKVNASYKDNWVYWNLIYKQEKGTTYTAPGTFCDDPRCGGCTSIDHTYNTVCLQPDCKDEILRQMEYLANNTGGKVVKLSDVSSLSLILQGVIRDNIDQFTITAGERRPGDERYVFSKKLLLPIGGEFVEMKLWVYRNPLGQ